MSEQAATPAETLPDPEELNALMVRIAEQSQRIVQDFVTRQASAESMPRPMLDPVSIGKAFGELTAQMMQDPTRVFETQLRFWQEYTQLWHSATARMLGNDAEPMIHPHKSDKRFKDEAWNENPVFDYIKQSYLLASRYLTECVEQTEGLDDKTAQRVQFYTQQFVDAMAPSNFAALNPQVLQETLDSGGKNLLQGLSNMLEDLERGKGELRIRMTDESKFELGVNVAATPGKVVYQNELMQLIQYTPTTETVHKRPLLIVPPWINKYYILDLREKNSFVRWAVAEGHTVFVISWVNPDEQLAEKSFEDYMLEGPIEALAAIEQATGERQVKAIGYCLGGTLLACMLAWMKAKKDDRINCATFFTTMLDFSDPGELGVFIDEEQLKLLDDAMAEKGYLDGSRMATAFNMLRANDLIWSFVVNNYLLGREPFPFDLLYWNGDSTRMPRAMHSFYLHTMYEQNLLASPGALVIDGVPIDLATIDVPCYFLSTKEDHIAPWLSTYAGTRLFDTDLRFVLGASGHIAGVINPPAANKYGFWSRDDAPESPEDFIEGARFTEGSWWDDWKKWVSRFNGQKKVPARQPGDGKLEVLEDAPGSYVKVRAV